MKHRSIAQLLSSLLVCSVSAFTQLQAASVSDLSYGLIDNSTAYAVTDIDANATGSLVVPSTHNGLPVTEIGQAAFQGFRDHLDRPAGFHYCDSGLCV
jgi:hypothetical protein